MSWKLSAMLSRHEQKHEEHEKRHTQLDEKINKADSECAARFTKLEAEQDRRAEEQGNRWNEINRTLGNIQGEVNASRKR